MTLRHLQIFCAIARTGSFTGAARQLYLTQSAVSHAIRELEEAAGTALFERQTRGVKLTGCGRGLLERAGPLLQSFGELESSLSLLGEQAPVRVASGITIASFWLPLVLKKLELVCPGQQVFVQVLSAAKAMEALDAGEADVALVEGACPAGAYQCRRFASYSLAAVCAPDFPAPGGTLDFQQLCALPLLLREAGSAVRAAVDSALYLHGLQVRPKWVSVNSGALLEAAKAGLGVAILPEQLVAEEIRRNGVRQISLGEPGLENSLWSVLRAQSVPNGAVQNLLEQIYHGSWGSQAVQTQPDGK